MPATTEDDERAANEVDEQFRGLLESLRTSLPGVQVLFAFLLIAPFQTDFTSFGTATRTAFTVAFLSSGLASVLLIAPSVQHRVRAPISGLTRRSKRHLIIATWLTIVGTVAMGVAIVATVFLVSTFVFSDGWAIVASTAIATVLVWSWFYLPVITFSE